MRKIFRNKSVAHLPDQDHQRATMEAPLSCDACPIKCSPQCVPPGTSFAVAAERNEGKQAGGRRSRKVGGGSDKKMMAQKMMSALIFP